MALFDQIFEKLGVPTLMAHLGDDGEQGLYLLPRDADPVGPFEAIVGPETDVEVDSGEGREIRRTRIVALPLQDDLPFWDGSNVIGLVVAIGEVNWTIQAVESLTPNLATLRLVRRGSAEFSRPGYRRR